MPRDRVRPLVLAVLCLLALGTAAATLTDAATDSTGGGLGGDGPTVGSGGDGGVVPADPGTSILPGGGGISGGGCLSVTPSPPVTVGVVAAFLLGIGIAIRRTDPRTVALSVGAVLPIVVLIGGLLFAGCPADDGGSGWEGGSLGPGSGSGTFSTPSTLIAVVLAAGLVIAVAALGLDDGEGNPPPEPTGGPDAVADAAGRAVDRIEGGQAVTNEVYRAWREMAASLAVDRAAATSPAEFADAAVGAGFDPAAVEELTALFESVRYGDAAATDERERRAIDALRRIERDGDGNHREGR
ncbi:hypothetical protein BRD17_05490 [Halobacteriales archaeon SW_7_68_16]|nr:MAG: hypothetical protein BRD17_05490 [Halobacteriales archaeon SW_7_68_16]